MPRTGRPPAITQDDILEVLRERDPQEYPVMTAPEITEHVDASRQTVVNRLKEMDFTDEINTAEVAGTPVWWPPEEEDPTEGAEPARPDDTDPDPDDGDDVHDHPDAEEHDVVTDGRGLAREVEYRSALWASRSAALGVLLGVVGAIAWALTRLPLPEVVPALAGTAAIIAGFMAVLASVVLIGFAFLLAWMQGHGWGDLVEYILERALYPMGDPAPPR